jgi:Uma2 family endonuclease
MAVHEILIPTIELPVEDGEPLETNWHRCEINLLIDSIRAHWSDRKDFYTGGNMFVYYSADQVRNRDYRGPDFYVVLDVDGSYMREAWVVWNEDGRYPDIIVELLSASTAEEDRTTKKELYERTFHTKNYFLYDPDQQVLTGWELGPDGYVELQPNAEGRLWSSTLDLWLGKWEGEYLSERAIWLRFFDVEGNLVPIAAEAERQHAAEAQRLAEEERLRAREERLRAEEEHLRAEEERLRAMNAEALAEAAQRQAEAERQRAEQAEQRSLQSEAEVERLRAALRAAGLDPDAVG